MKDRSLGGGYRLGPEKMLLDHENQLERLDKIISNAEQLIARQRDLVEHMRSAGDELDAIKTLDVMVTLFGVMQTAPAFRRVLPQTTSALTAPESGAPPLPGKAVVRLIGIKELSGIREFTSEMQIAETS
jgi:hypothetical protein